MNVDELRHHLTALINHWYWPWFFFITCLCLDHSKTRKLFFEDKTNEKIEKVLSMNEYPPFTSFFDTDHVFRYTKPILCFRSCLGFLPFRWISLFWISPQFSSKRKKKKITFLLDKILLHLRIASLENSAVREWPRSNWRTFSVLDKTLSEY